MIRALLIILLISGCGVPPDDWKNTRPGSDDQLMARMDASMEKWIVASQHLP